VAESLGAAVLTVSVDDRQFQAGLNAARSKADVAAGQITQSFGGISNGLRQLAGVAGIVGIGALTQQLIATGQEAQRAQIQLNALAGAYGEAAGAGEAAARIQKVLGISAVDATQGFAQLYAALRGTGIGLQQLEVLFVGISNAARLSGAGTQEAQAALLQLKQGLAAGVLQGDELRSVLEQLPAFAQAIAQQLGTNVGQLRKLGSEGKITAEAVFNAAKQLATATVPGRNEIEQLGIAFENVKAQAAAALGPPLLGALQTTAAGLIAFKKFLEDNQQALINVGRSVIEIGKTFAPFVAGILAVQAAMKAWSIASKAVATAQAAVLALQGPKGWAILAGAVTASAVAAGLLEKTLAGVGKATKDAKSEAQAAFEQFKQILSATTLNTPGSQLAKNAEATKKWAAELKSVNDILSIQESIAIEQQRGRLTSTGVGALQSIKAFEDAKRAEKNAQAALRAGQAEDASKRKELLNASRLASEQVRLASAQAKADLEDAFKSAQESVKSISRSIEDSVTQLQQLQNTSGAGLNEFMSGQQVSDRQAALSDQLRPIAQEIAKRRNLNFTISGTNEDRNNAILRLIQADRQQTRLEQDLAQSRVDLGKAQNDLATINQSLVSVNSDLASATQALANKDWNVYVSVPGGSASGDVVREGVYQ
jgi:tape measure domain-containing protein